MRPGRRNCTSLSNPGFITPFDRGGTLVPCSYFYRAINPFALIVVSFRSVLFRGATPAPVPREFGSCIPQLPSLVRRPSPSLSLDAQGDIVISLFISPRLGFPKSSRGFGLSLMQPTRWTAPTFVSRALSQGQLTCKLFASDTPSTGRNGGVDRFDTRFLPLTGNSRAGTLRTGR